MQYFGFDRPSFAFKTLGFGANFDPLDLFSGGKQGVWFDPSDKSTLFQDVAGTVPVTKDGDPVALMRDKSGNGSHATQALSAARPLYKTDGILHWLQFDGVDDCLVILNQNWLEGGLHSALFSIAYKASGGIGYVFHNSTSFGDQAQNGVLFNESGLDVIRGSSIKFQSSTSAVALAYKYNLSTSDSSYYKNGVKINGGVVSGVKSSKIVLGARTSESPAVFCKHNLYAMLAVNDYVDDATLSNVQIHSASKSGVIL